jgi:chromosome segregation ATPase
MADDTSGGRNTRDIERAAQETREPAKAKELRERDNERTEEHLDDVEEGAAQADATLHATSRQLEENATDLTHRRRELERTGEIAREVASDVTELHQQVKRTHDRAAELRPRDAGERRSKED